MSVDVMQFNILSVIPFLARRILMTKKDVGPVEELGGNVERFAGEEVRRGVMEGSERIASMSKEGVAAWVKGAMERLDNLVDEETRVRIMTTCGHTCASMNRRPIEMAMKRRAKYGSDDEFIEAEMRKPMKGTRLSREGDMLYYTYTPKTFRSGLRCYCSLVSGLPSDEEISLTYCLCSRGFVERLWEDVLGRPVKVELLESSVSGSQECKFAICLRT